MPSSGAAPRTSVSHGRPAEVPGSQGPVGGLSLFPCPEGGLRDGSRCALRESIVHVCDVPDDPVPDATLEELGVDSLAAAEVITDMEIRTGARAAHGRAARTRRLRTVGEVTDYLQCEMLVPIRRRAVSMPAGLCQPGTSPARSGTTTTCPTTSSGSWLGDDLVYSCALWEARRRPDVARRGPGTASSTTSPTGSGCAGPACSTSAAAGGRCSTASSASTARPEVSGSR